MGYHYVSVAIARLDKSNGAGSFPPERSARPERNEAWRAERSRTVPEAG
jgi:hypothetical protein